MSTAGTAEDRTDEEQLLPALDAALWLARVLERTRAPLTTSQFRMMRRAAAGGERAARLAERLAVRKPTLTAIADGLVAGGFLIREADSTDRRVVRLELTAEGRAALAETERIYADRFTELLDDAPDRDLLLDQLSGLETRRVARLNAAPQPGITQPTSQGADGK
ncbi:MarR family winged helix-turn-helix transcriptional regulator [Microlunatus soli]|uniref:DNA-binding transcriptional regulator, MarR family n=1 Tax=Microlunatus soli TaxID=630515 RepID=A0A1H1YWR7_9ACTN|nr:MarR family transcriptional regulator [Microlunatus soli]SDT25406.1 DNA-binding transcriptional regulator, MarR family [Microlunatus soli]